MGLSNQDQDKSNRDEIDYHQGENIQNNFYISHAATQEVTSGKDNLKYALIIRWIVFFAAVVLLPFFIFNLTLRNNQSKEIYVFVIQEDGTKLSGAEVVFVGDKKQSKVFITDDSGYINTNLNILNYKDYQIIIRKQGFEAVIVDLSENIFNEKDTPVTKIYKLPRLRD